MTPAPPPTGIPWIDPTPVAGRQIATGRIVACLGPAPYDEIPRGGAPTPQAFLVETDSPIAVHFHPVPQFQVFVSGQGGVGRHGARPGSVHYADAFTPYGPLRPVGGSVGYLTLRAEADAGAAWMPEHRAELAEGRRRSPAPRRNLTLDLGAAPPASDRADLLQADDGLGVAVVDVTAAETVTVPGSSGGGFVVVLDGSVVARRPTASRAPLGPGAFAWRPPAAATEIHAGPVGARIAWLRFPVATGTDPDHRVSVGSGPGSPDR